MGLARVDVKLHENAKAFTSAWHHCRGKWSYFLHKCFVFVIIVKDNRTRARLSERYSRSAFKALIIWNRFNFVQ
jgi:hypothetical protein